MPGSATISGGCGYSKQVTATCHSNCCLVTGALAPLRQLPTAPAMFAVTRTAGTTARRTRIVAIGAPGALNVSGLYALFDHCLAAADGPA